MKSFIAILIEASECCQHVNRMRHSVDARVEIKDGKLPEHYMCSWCGATHPMTDDMRRWVRSGGFVIETGENGYTQVEVDGVHIKASTVEFS